MDIPVVPVSFRQMDDHGRVSLANFSTRAYLKSRNVELVEGMMLRLCEPAAGGGHKVDWLVAEAIATFDSQADRWMAVLAGRADAASSLPATHWARTLEPDFLGRLAHGRGKEYEWAALISLDEDRGKVVTVLALSPEDAVRQFEAEYGEGNVVSLWNTEFAKRPR